MKPEDILLIKLITGCFKNKAVLDTDLEKYDWAYIYREAIMHNISELLYYSITQVYGISLEKSFIDSWQKNSLFSGIRQHMNVNEISGVISLLNNEGAPVMPLKGLFYRDLYPSPELRTMGDFDLLVKKEDYDKAYSLLCNLGYEPKRQSSSKETHFFHKSKQMIELHWLVFDPDCLENIESFEASVWKNSVPYNINGVETRILSINDQLVHIFIHMVFHIKFSGFGIRQLCDLVLLMDSKGNEIDWSYFTEYMLLFNIKKFADAIMVMCSKYFLMSIPEGYKLTYECNMFSEHLLEDVFSSGVHGRKTEIRSRVNEMIAFKKKDMDKAPVRISQYFSFMFPAGAQLSEKYSFARKNPLLLPVVWIGRLLTSLRRKNLFKTVVFYLKLPKGAIKLYKKRSRLLKDLNLR